MPKKRNQISTLTQKQLLQECGAQCPFCGESEVATFEHHHIDENPANNAIKNLIVVCASCHAKITRGIISMADVAANKRELQGKMVTLRKDTSSVNVNIQDSSFAGDIAHNITKITTNKQPRIVHPPSSIGANLAMKAYVDYLIDRYFKYRKADASYGRRTPFSHAVIHTNIQKNLGAKTFFLPEVRFPALVEYLTSNINSLL